MTQESQLTRLGLFDARVPRYTSYPTAPHFAGGVTPATFSDWVEAIPAGSSISLYLHIPFCRRLCWFCACRTQGTSSDAPVIAYVETLKSEIRLLRERLAPGVKLARLHWGGGTPTLLDAARISDLAASVFDAVPMAEGGEFSVEIDPNDLRIDVYRSSGPGGQSVNTTDSAVRITHLPTNIVVTSSMKSQHQNREIAMNALKSRLYQLELDRRNAEVNAQHAAKGDAGWGNQIRSYVLQPYQMVKDLRTGVETSDTQGVLDGDLDKFMAATLAMDVAGKSRAEAMADD